MSRTTVPELSQEEQSVIRHLAGGTRLSELPAALGMSENDTRFLYTGLCDLLGSPRNPAALVAVCYATEVVQPPDVLDPSGIAMPAEEQALLPLFAMGMGEHSMAQRLGRKRWKVNQQATAVLENLQVRTRAQAVHVAWQYQIVTGAAIRSWLKHGRSTDTEAAPPRRPGPALYIQAREGEFTGTPQELCAARGPADALLRLSYWDQAEGDRDEHGALWVRAQEILSRSGRPVGRPVKDVHPARQPDTMRRQHCRLCFFPASLELTGAEAFLYLVTDSERRRDGSYRTAEPPACIEHALLCAESEQRLRGGYTALLVTSSALSGVLGTRFGPLGDDVNFAPVGDEEFHPYADTERLRWVLASRLVRDLVTYKVTDLRNLVREAFRTTAVRPPSHPASRAGRG